MWTLIKSLLVLVLIWGPEIGHGQNMKVKKMLQPVLDSLYKFSRVPGISVSIIMPNNKAYKMVAGYQHRQKQQPMRTNCRFLGGSTGKTFVSAVALKLIESGILDPEAKISTYLEHIDWFHRLPNAYDITVKMLFNHTSGLVRYEFKEQFIRDWVKMPDKQWTVIDRLQYILDQPAPFKAGTAWDYSDTNYILLGLIIEEITGKTYYDLLKHWISRPLKLKNTGPAVHAKIKRLSPGYAGRSNLFGVPDEIVKKRELQVNPQVEWTGGGLFTTAADLAKWAKIIYSHQFFTENADSLLYVTVPAKLGNENLEYGYGVMLRQSAAGRMVGHGGFFPGYLAEMYYLPDLDLSIAVLYNSSDFSTMRVTPWQLLQTLAVRIRTKISAL